MGIFKSKEEKEYEKKSLVRKSVNSMNKQINNLEEQKKVFLEKAKIAKKNGLTSQYNLALTAYKQTLLQQRRAQEMLLNFEITSQMKDMSMMTKEFLGAMGSLSHDMAKLSDEKEFLKVQKEFEIAMSKAENQAEQMDMFMEESQDRFQDASGSTSSISNKEIEDYIEQQSSLDEDSDDLLDKELEDIEKQINAQL